MKRFRKAFIVLGVLVILTVPAVLYVRYYVKNVLLDYNRDYYCESIQKIEITRTVSPFDTCLSTKNGIDICKITYCLHQSSLTKKGCPEALEWRLAIYGDGPNYKTGDIFFTDGVYFRNSTGYHYKHKPDQCYKFDKKDNAIYTIISRK